MWLQLYLGLLVVVGYIVLSIQIIIKRADSGVLDYVGDVVLIYTNLVGVYLRFLLSSWVRYGLMNLGIKNVLHPQRKGRKGSPGHWSSDLIDMRGRDAPQTVPPIFIELMKSMTARSIVARVHCSRGIRCLGAKKIEPLSGVNNGITGWADALEDDLVPVDPNCPSTVTMISFHRHPSHPKNPTPKPISESPIHVQSACGQFLTPSPEFSFEFSLLPSDPPPSPPLWDSHHILANPHRLD